MNKGRKKEQRRNDDARIKRKKERKEKGSRERNECKRGKE